MRAPAGLPTGLALARARRAVELAGLDPALPLKRVSSVTNEVWVSPQFVVRVSRTLDRRLAREASLAAELPAAVRYPEIIGFGSDTSYDWLISRRKPGVPLSRAWPFLSEAARRNAIYQLAGMLRALHAVEPPAALSSVAAPHRLSIGDLLDGLEDVGLSEHSYLVHETRSRAEPLAGSTLVHGDLTFENVLWYGGEITALIDFEYARPAPADLDLDVLLRFCAYPELHVAADYAHQARPEDYADVPVWLAEAYPELFAAANLVERLRLYSVAFDIAELRKYPASVATRQRLLRTLSGRSYVERFSPVT